MHKGDVSDGSENNAKEIIDDIKEFVEQMRKITDARTLEKKMNYIGMEKAARKVLIDEKLAKVEEVAMMTCIEVCKKILESYEVVSCESENITIVKKEDMKTYSDIARFLSR